MLTSGSRKLCEGAEIQQFISDIDGDADVLGTRGNSEPYDGVIWLEQIRSSKPQQTFTPARIIDSQQLALPKENL